MCYFYFIIIPYKPVFFILFLEYFIYLFLMHIVFDCMLEEGTTNVIVDGCQQPWGYWDLKAVLLEEYSARNLSLSLQPHLFVL